MQEAEESIQRFLEKYKKDFGTVKNVLRDVHLLIQVYDSLTSLVVTPF